MKYILIVLILTMFAIAQISASCNVVSCSQWCRNDGHFGGYCTGGSLENCHCYDVGHGNQ